MALRDFERVQERIVLRVEVRHLVQIGLGVVVLVGGAFGAGYVAGGGLRAVSPRVESQERIAAAGLVFEPAPPASPAVAVVPILPTPVLAPRVAATHTDATATPEAPATAVADGVDAVGGAAPQALPTVGPDVAPGPGALAQAADAGPAAAAGAPVETPAATLATAGSVALAVPERAAPAASHPDPGTPPPGAVAAAGAKTDAGTATAATTAPPPTAAPAIAANSLVAATPSQSTARPATPLPEGPSAAARATRATASGRRVVPAAPAQPATPVDPVPAPGERDAGATDATAQAELDSETGEPASLGATAGEAGSARKGFTVQIKAFRNEPEAQAFQQLLRGKGHPTVLTTIEVPGKGMFYRVRIGPFATLDQARAAQRRFELQEGYTTMILVQP